MSFLASSKPPRPRRSLPNLGEAFISMCSRIAISSSVSGFGGFGDRGFGFTLIGFGAAGGVLLAALPAVCLDPSSSSVFLDPSSSPAFFFASRARSASSSATRAASLAARAFSFAS